MTGGRPRGRRSGAPALGVAALLIAVAAGTMTAGTGPPPSGAPAAEAGVAQLRSLPMAFEANVGQYDPAVRFAARAADHTVFLTAQGAVVALGATGDGGSAAVRLALVPGPAVPTSQSQPVGLDPLPGRVNHLRAGPGGGLATGVATYGRVAQRDAVPGIDLIYYAKGPDLEYDVVVGVGTDPTSARFSIEGAQSIDLDPGGDLLITTVAGVLTQHRPVAYQEVGGVRRAVDSDFVLGPAATFGFRVGAYDPGLPLVIDPVLTYSTLLGSDHFDDVNTVAVDGSGQAYVAGRSFSSGFPVTLGALDTTLDGDYDGYVAKLDAAGSTVIYATFLGGSALENIRAIAVDGAGAAYVAGVTESADFPVTPGAPSPTFGGFADAFVSKLAPDGATLVYSTFLGGLDDDGALAIAVDDAGAAYVAGTTEGLGFPVTAGALDTVYNGDDDAFVAKLQPDGLSLAYSTFLGSSGSDVALGIALDATGGAYVTGSTAGADFPVTPGAFDSTLGGRVDAFVAQIDSQGSQLVYATYVGGDATDEGRGIAVDSAGAAYVVGWTGRHVTSPPTFPTTAGAFDRTLDGDSDAFVAKLAPGGSALAYSTLLGGSGPENVGGIAVDSAGRAHVAGYTKSADFPTTPGDIPHDPADADSAFVARLNRSGTALNFSTLLGGSGVPRAEALALDASGAVYVVGGTGPDFPTTPGASDTTHNGASDVFVTKLAIPAMTLGGPFAVWAQPPMGPLDGIGTWLATANRPAAAARQLPPEYLYAQIVGFTGSPGVGVVGLLTDPSGRFALFSVIEPDGTAHHAAVPFEWSEGRFYFLLVHQPAPGLWAASVFDHTAQQWTHIGFHSLPPGWGTVSPVSVSTASWYGDVAADCTAFPRADVLFHPPLGYAGGQVGMAALASTDSTHGTCPPDITDFGVWSRFRLGADAAAP